MSSFTLSNVYSNFLTAYSPKSTRYDTHKKDELKSVYNRIVKKSEDSPLFLMDQSGESQKYALSLKENARDLKNTISSLSSDYSSNVLDKKIASSSDKDIVDAKYMGSDGVTDSASSFEVEVHQIASSQVNIGRFLPGNAPALAPDSYSFDVHINDTDYEFQFGIDPGETNQDLQNRIARLVTNANIGISAAVIPGENGTSALRLESTATGAKADASLDFLISDDQTSRRKGTVDYLGLDLVAHTPTNALFSIDGEERSSYSNTVNIGNAYELTLKAPQEEGAPPVRIGLKADLEALTDNINNLAGAYNDFIRRAAEYTSSYGKSNRFMYEMSSLTRQYTNGLDAVGLSMQADGTISVDKDLLAQSAAESDPKDSLDVVQRFTNALVNKTGQVTIDPMQYADQVIVAYKNPGKNFPNPYVPSMYSGMMFSSYC